MNESVRDRLLGQLEYVAEEVGLLQEFLPRIDVDVLRQESMDGAKNVFDSLIEMNDRQRALAADLGVEIPVSHPDAGDLNDLLSRFKNDRISIVAALREIQDFDNSIAESGEPVPKVIHTHILEESALLQHITIRLHESNLFRL